jgi:erythrocyte band 7 integral membrane protein
MTESRLLMQVDGEDGEDPVFVRKQTEPCMGGCLDILGVFCGCFCLTTTCGCCCNPYKTVRRGYRGVITRFGTIKQVTGDGLHYVNPISEEIKMADVMLHVKKLSNQSVLTKDNLPITIDGAVYYKTNNNITDIIKSNYSVYDIRMCVDELSHSTLRLVFGKHTLQECLEKRQEFATEIKSILSGQAASWGVMIQDIQIIDIVLPKHIQDLLATSATAVREGEAEIIMAQARVKSAHMMREAADQLNTPAAMQMRQLETYKILAESENAKIIFMPGTPLDNVTANLVGNQCK